MLPRPDEYEMAADTLRAWALDEALKERVMSDPALARAARRVAGRYTAGDTIDDAVASVRASMARGHLGSIEYAGESVRDADLAREETARFIALAAAIRESEVPSTVSFDLSHVGSVISYDLGLEHARQMAEATAPFGTALMISAEGSGRTDLVLDLYDALAADYSHVGITLQARLHRTAADLDRVLAHPGTVRLVKGAFLEPEGVAYRRGSIELTDSYLNLAARLLAAGQPASFATHDSELVEALVASHGDRLKSPDVEFEMLLGLGTTLLDRLHGEGYRTREYVIFGEEWWLYVLNRIAEQPGRFITALADLRSA
ncbi:L-proline dehydrogenase [Arthrobacter sp. ok909]|jgi:proline dehydrogenase|uniref:proline dehydrogenase family protein n=1 Tax=Arthrobacter sp. ok909 TaxID=1761746 RepID=UPI000892798C|nr:proline dehydrogenase family protein [Arthrobacter sp. ok909]SDP77692.1 L-proline dehydrogenase [Arthrobacter sp. ok909]